MRFARSFRLRRGSARVAPSLVALPVVALFAALSLSPLPELGAARAAERPTTRLFDFDADETPWVAVNDGVMGGVSSGRVVTKAGIVTFSGTVRLENNGGFASFRSATEVGTVPDRTDTFEVRVKGDGKAYQFTVDTEVGWYWFKMVPPKGKWSTLSIPFATLVPVSRFGEPVKRDAFTGKQQVSRIGVLISNKRAEKFSISFDWVGVTGAT